MRDAFAPDSAMRRLYRGLKEPYRPDKVKPQVGTRLISTDFTDCPHTALLYAHGKRGVALVVDIPANTARVTEEFWLAGPARRLMVWGSFDGFIVAILPAKDLRARVRAKGVVAASDKYKALVLKRAIPELLQDHARLRDPTTRRTGADHLVSNTAT